MGQDNCVEAVERREIGDDFVQMLTADFDSAVDEHGVVTKAERVRTSADLIAASEYLQLQVDLDREPCGARWNVGHVRSAKGLLQLSMSSVFFFRRRPIAAL